MGNNEQRTHRCVRCDKNWPYNPTYLKCPICGQDTYSTSAEVSDVLTPANALTETKKHQEEIDKRIAIEQQMDNVVVDQALANLDEELQRLLC